MQSQVIYDLLADNKQLVRCAIPFGVSLLVFALLKALHQAQGGSRTITIAVSAGTLLLGATLSVVMSLSQWSARSALARHATLQTCGQLTDLTRYGRGSERFHVGQISFTVSPSIWEPGFGGPVSGTPWALTGGPLLVEYIVGGGGSALALRLSAVANCSETRTLQDLPRAESGRHDER